ncbi:hypothetical protein NC653_028690 [Populus alba x Populus x berolinensis]|uniref:Uncharacterized protein n=1 Tax=Populus alba x Populus x berolinensis TaxID=444605 RepID=A0AAD6Q3N6_9ROSI|nr:hypothetical protein NC653_028690 [Populus alba x Populus x berolinensis]
MITNGTILDIGCGSNLRNFTEEIRDQMERESRMGKLYIQISMICKQQHPSMIKFVKVRAGTDAFGTSCLKQAKITEENKAMEVISASIEHYKD